MNYGPLIFLAAFFALSTSWFGLVLSPQLQVGRMQQTNTIPDGLTYPLARSGLARQGLDVYRANGCAYCHSQQARQSGTLADVLVTDAGTNEAALVQAILNLKPDTTESAIKEKLPSLPFAVKEHVGRGEAESALKGLNVVGAKAELWVVPVGPDMARYWGKRHSVAEDFLYDYPVMPGSQRIGPDLANVGLRWPDANWHLRHLYAPSLEITNSPMPPYRYLFEKRRVERVPSPDAMRLPSELSPPPGFEIVPRPEAKALVAYLTSLHATEPLFDAPVTVPPAPSTNAPAATNAAPATAPGK